MDGKFLWKFRDQWKFPKHFIQIQKGKKLHFECFTIFLLNEKKRGTLWDNCERSKPLHLPSKKRKFLNLIETIANFFKANRLSFSSNVSNELNSISHLKWRLSVKKKKTFSMLRFAQYFISDHWFINIVGKNCNHDENIKNVSANSNSLW